MTAFHDSAQWTPPGADTNLYGYGHVFHPWFMVGAYGAHLFFVISGLVITMTVVRSAGVGGFVVRRPAQIYPALISAATLAFLLMPFGPEAFRAGLADDLANHVVDANERGRTPVEARPSIEASPTQRVSVNPHRRRACR